MKKTLLTFSAVMVILFSSCSKNAGGVSGINFQLSTSATTANATGITWTAGTAGVVYAKVEASKSDNSQIEFKSAANTQTDLFAAASISNVSIAAGTYHAVEFRTELQSMSGKPSLFLSGTFTAAAVTTPISFEVGTSITIKSEKDSIVINASNGSYTALTTLVLATLTQNVTAADISAATLTSGKIVISATSNTVIFNKMLANLLIPKQCDFR